MKPNVIMSHGRRRQSVMKRALIIGINYVGTHAALTGCVRDAEYMRERLVYAGFQSEHMVMLTDTSSIKPTRSNIIAALKTLLTASKPGDLLVLSYSGHGTRARDRDGNELTRMDQIIVSSDLKTIVDDEMKALLRHHMKPRTTLFALFDCCYSGTILDLKFTVSPNNSLVVNQKETLTPGRVVMISGCTDTQISEEGQVGGSAQVRGVLTWALLAALADNPPIGSWRALVDAMRTKIKHQQYSQVPLLSFGRPGDDQTGIFI